MMLSHCLLSGDKVGCGDAVVLQLACDNAISYEKFKNV